MARTYTQMLEAIQYAERGSERDLGAALKALADTALPVIVPDGAAYTVLAENTGKQHIISEQTADVTLTLPTGVAGMRYSFIGGGVAAEAQDWIFTAITPNFLNAGVQFFDTDEPASPALLTSVFGNGSSHLTLTVNTPSPAGTYVDFYFNGTEWVVNGHVFSATVPAFS